MSEFIVICCLLFVVKENEQMRVAVVSGQRPDLRVINGAPDSTLMKLAVDWMKRCWHQNPDRRPAFAGILHELIVDVSLEESGYKYVLF